MLEPEPVPRLFKLSSASPILAKAFSPSLTLHIAWYKGGKKKAAMISMERNKLKYEREKKTCIYVAPKKENKIGNALIHTIEITNKSTIYASCPNKRTAVHFKSKCPTENRFMT
jgi:hypothetical protein